MNYPDFLCVGLPKTGTTWLYHHLKSHDGVWLPPVKEIAFMWGYVERNYSSTQLFEHRKYVFRKKRRYLVENLKRRFGNRSVGVASTLSWDMRYALLPQTEHWYKNLFPIGTQRLRGDISPQYHVFKEKEIAKIHAMNPSLKIILILRNPVDRLWSYARMKMVSSGKLNQSLLSEADWKEKIDEGMNECPDYLEIINRWSVYFKEQLKVVYYDELVEKPRDFLMRIQDFLGLPNNVPVENDLSNKIWKGVEIELPHALERYLIQQNFESIRQLHASTNEGNVLNWLHQYEHKMAIK